mgnify:CR=1 FL=1
MNPGSEKLAGGLYFVATPIGNARDITLRTLDILGAADVIAAEDTRSLRRLMEIHGVALGDRPLLAYHDHNGPQMRPRLLAALEAGKSVAYASEAGTPLLADPGFVLAREAAAAGAAVTAAPGPSALLAALCVAGLPSDHMFFAGFLPNARGARRTALEGFRDIPGTLVFYESPKRVAAMLGDAAEVLGGERPAVMCRELTKKFEEVRRGTLNSLAEALKGTAVKGEVVVLVDRGRSGNVREDDLEESIRAALKDMSVRDAADAVSAAHGVPKRKVYQLALKLGQEDAE